MVNPDFYTQQNRKVKCKKCGVEKNFKSVNSNGLCKKCEKASKNCELGSFVK